MQEHTQKKNIREIRRRSDDVELMEMGCNDKMEIQGDENDFIYCWYTRLKTTLCCQLYELPVLCHIIKVHVNELGGEKIIRWEIWLLRAQHNIVAL